MEKNARLFVVDDYLLFGVRRSGSTFDKSGKRSESSRKYADADGGFALFALE